MRILAGRIVLENPSPDDPAEEAVDFLRFGIWDLGVDLYDGLGEESLGASLENSMRIPGASLGHPWGILGASLEHLWSIFGASLENALRML